jgi:CHAT domain-containing protein
MWFRDPAGQYLFRLPLGWAYDAERSHLITVAFLDWQQPEATLTVRALPTAAPPNVPPHEWSAKVGEGAPGPLTTVRCAGALAVRVEAEAADEPRRLLCVRGPRIDVLVEQRGETDLPDPLAAICRSLQVPANRLLPHFVEQDQVYTDLQAAAEAAEAGDWNSVFDPAVRAHASATSTYLWSVVGNAFYPEIPAIAAVVDALNLFGRAAGSLAHLRDAEHLTARGLFTNAHLPMLSAERRHEVDQELRSRRDHSTAVQAAILDVGDGPRNTATLAMQRAPKFERDGQQLIASQSYEGAVRFLEVAIADHLLALAALARADAFGKKNVDALPASLVAQFVAAGVDDPDAQQALAGQLASVARLQQLEDVARLLPQLALARTMVGDTQGSLEATRFAISVADRVVAERQAEPEAIERERPDPRIGKTLALLQHAAALADVADEASLEDANDALTKAEDLLDALGEEAGLRAWACLLRISLMHSSRLTGNALEIIERGLAAAARGGPDADETALELKGMKSQFLGLAGREAEAAEVIAEVVAAPEGEGPRDRLRRANHFLNLAVVQSQRGDREDAVTSLAEAARRLVEVAPLSEEALRTFVVGYRVLAADLPLAYQLNVAATATLDARRLGFAEEALGVGLAEASRRREIYADLVSRLFEVDMVDHALAAADRSRARALLETLAPLTPPPAEPSPLPEVPDLDGLEPREILGRCADYAIYAAIAELERQGAAVPLEGDELRPLMARLGTTALVLQPVHERLALFVARPSGEIDAVYSPLSLDELLEASADAAAALRIYSVPRGAADSAAADAAAETAATTEAAESGQQSPLDSALARLWDAIIAPVADWLQSQAPLVIVPYRETALVPFALLREPGGKPLIDTHALSVAPSLATLNALRSRGEWARPRPKRAYIAADPAIADRFLAAGLGRLAGARAEAAAIASALRAHGVDGDDLVVLEDAAADEQSYRSRARDCDLVHLSCHATLNEPASTSCLYLAANGSDGQLLVSEIAQVPLDDALVFLAACDSGQGRPTAEGVIGVGRAFLEAGARAVAMSLWKVADAATAALCVHFYRALLDDEERDAAHALQRAMEVTRDDLAAGRIKDIEGRVLDARDAYWAPFTLVGDATAIKYTTPRREQK